MGLITLSRGWAFTVNETGYDLRVVYVEPHAHLGGAAVISFDEFAATVERHDDSLSKRFARSLRTWTAINPGEAIEEKVSLSDRFGLWLGFHPCSQDEYLAMVEGYVGYFRVPVAADALRAEALEWATTRGSRSGRVAWQFVQDLAGRCGVTLEEPR